MQARVTTIMILALLTGAPLAAAQELPPAPWYLGGAAGIARVDDQFGASDDGGFVRGIIGRQLDHRLTLELEGGFGSVDFDNGADVDQTHIGLNLLIVNREPSWNPYFLAGFGAFDQEADAFSDTGAMAQLGIGGMWDLNGYGLMLRADLRYRYSDLDVEVIDKGQPMLSIGLDFPFGR